MKIIIIMEIRYMNNNEKYMNKNNDNEINIIVSHSRIKSSCCCKRHERRQLPKMRG